MTSYTTLGEAANTAVLYANADGTNRKVTTLPHDQARNLAHALDRALATISNALWDVAVAYDGKPSAARRTLLTRFDTIAAGHSTTEPGDAWTLAFNRIDRVAAAVAGQPAAVIAATRRELAETTLAGLDDILVAGVLWAECYRPAFLRLVLNPVMGPWTTGERQFEPFFDGLDDAALALDTIVTEPTLRVDLGHYYADDTWMIIDMLRGEGSCHDDLYGEGTASGIFADSGSETPSLQVQPAHLRAWMAANRPDLLEAYPQVGA